ncbi:RlmE family RNA methyltransferase [Pelagibacteraceae bacterium]|nr:RlmE family RNA methyltransferase [Pelagibacteraceae bacterium]
MKRKKKINNWLTKKNKEQFFKKSKIEGYRARSAYKLLEINKKFNFLKKGICFLDLGSSPGGWSQVASKIIMNGKLLGVDIKEMNKIDNVSFVKGDFNDPDIYKKIINYFNRKINVVVSDMAANTSGNKNLDSFRTGELCINAMKLSLEILENDGVFVSKVFMGSIFNEINEMAKKSFKKVVTFKPLSSKKESREIYIYCKGISNYF